MSQLDQAENGQVLRWSRHPWLGEIAEALGQPDLAYEPVLCKTEDVSTDLLSLEHEDTESLRWHWNSWAAVTVKLCPPMGFDLAEESRQWSRGSLSALRWAEFPLLSRVELTPNRPDGSQGATRCLTRPTTVPLLRCRWDYLDRSSNRGVKIEVPVPASHRRPDRLEIVALELTGGERRLQRVGMRAVLGGRAFLPLWAEFRGVVAFVARSTGDQVCLLDLMSVNGYELLGRHLNEEEWSGVRQAVGEVAQGNAIGLGGWPERSRRYLTAFRNTAEALSLERVDDLSRRFPRGTFRAVVLRLAHPEISVWDDGVLERLETVNGADEVLETWMGAIWEYFARFPAAAERIWLMQHRFEPDLVDAAEWVATLKGRGAEALDRARRNLAWKSRLDQVIRQIRPDCKEAKEAAALLRSLEHGVLGADFPKTLESHLQNLEQSLRMDGNSAQPPTSKMKYQGWERRRVARLAWRAQVHAVLTFCEQGEWLSEPSSEAEIEGLAQRARALERITGDWNGYLQDEEELTRRIDAVVKNLEDEPGTAHRKAIITTLKQQILPSVSRWSGVHGVIRDAIQTAKRFPPLSADLGFPPRPETSLTIWASQARELTELEKELPAAAEGIKYFSDDLQKRYSILTNLGYRGLEVFLEERKRLRFLLEGHAQLAPLTESPPLKPDVSDANGYRVWWRLLAAAAADLSKLRISYHDLKRFSRGELRDTSWVDSLPVDLRNEAVELVQLLTNDEPSWVQVDRFLRLQQQARRQHAKR